MAKYPDIEVVLVDTDGNAFLVLGKVLREMKHFGVPSDKIEEFKKEAMSGDYDHFLSVVMEWVDVV